MPANTRRPSFDTLARRWCDLAERRRAYYIELYRSGRWTHYYNEEQVAARLRDAINAAKIWKQIVSPPMDVVGDLRPAA